MFFQTIATGKPCPSSHSISSSFPLLRLGTTVPEQWGHACADILLGESMLHPPRSQAGLSHRTNFLHHWWSLWRSGRVKAQMGLLSHSCSNTQRVTLLVFIASLLATRSLCVYVCVCVSTEGVILIFFWTTQFLALLFFTFHSIITPLIFLKAKPYSNGLSWLKTKCCRGDDSPHMCQWVSEFLCEA